MQPKNGSTIYSMRGGLQATLSEDFRMSFSGNLTRSSFERLYNGTAIADPLTTFEVGDALYFVDGFGIPGEVGDTIQLDGDTARAVITNVDYATNTLTLDAALTWSAGQGVSLAYEGSAPDVGAYEMP